MRIRLIKNVRMAGSSSVELLAGSVVNTTPQIANEWIKLGVAMEDKLLDGPTETKEHRDPWIDLKDPHSLQEEKPKRKKK